MSEEYHIDELIGFDGLTLHKAEIPALRNTNDVLVRIHAVSLNFRDIIISQNKYLSPIPAGVIPCSDGAGVVEKVAEGVTRFKPGDKVLTIFTQAHQAGDTQLEQLPSSLGGSVNGTLAKYGVFAETGLVAMPEHLSFEEGSTLPCAAVTAWNALFETPKPLLPGQTVLVQGTGGVSIFGLQLAKAAGAKVIVTSSSDAKLEQARKMGADYTINYRKTPDWGEQARSFAPEGVHHILEVGGTNTFENSCNAVRFGGVISIIGFLGSAGKKADGKDGGASGFIFSILSKSVMVRGILVGGRQSFEKMNECISHAKIKPVVNKVFDWENAREAYKYLWDQDHVGKVVIKVA